VNTEPEFENKMIYQSSIYYENL